MTIAGTIRIPPPTPKSPETKPAASPTAIALERSKPVARVVADRTVSVIGNLVVPVGCSADEARGPVAGCLLLEGRRLDTAARLDERAARLEAAAARRVHRVRDLAGEDDAPSLALGRRGGGGGGGGGGGRGGGGGGAGGGVGG